jgi:hypothetical protein
MLPRFTDSQIAIIIHFAAPLPPPTGTGILRKW